MQNHFRSNKKIGIIGGGQLGRMLALEAYHLGFSVICYSNTVRCPLAEVTPHQIIADYSENNLPQIQRLIDESFAITCEFENVPYKFLQKIEEMGGKLCPNSNAFFIAQNRIREKNFFKENNIPVASFLALEANSPSRLRGGARGGATLEVAEILNFISKSPVKKGIIKTAELGYDGKGQMKISATTTQNEVEEFISHNEGLPLIVEEFVEFKTEVSCIVARSQAGDCCAFPVGENLHENGILVKTTCPISNELAKENVAEKAQIIATEIANKLGIIGLLAVEFFVDKNNNLLVNEIAPRPHNSGHYTMSGCLTNQFEQCIRAISGLPFGNVDLLCNNVEMHNLIGEDISQSEEVLANPSAKLYDYGKKEIQSGRKMGHYNLFLPSPS